jgi:hypothetical protein
VFERAGRCSLYVSCETFFGSLRPGRRSFFCITFCFSELIHLSAGCGGRNALLVPKQGRPKDFGHNPAVVRGEKRSILRENGRKLREILRFSPVLRAYFQPEIEI